jgi:hypothetical protein
MSLFPLGKRSFLKHDMNCWVLLGEDDLYEKNSPETQGTLFLQVLEVTRVARIVSQIALNKDDFCTADYPS